jgi:hypothetical protein
MLPKANIPSLSEIELSSYLSYIVMYANTRLSQQVTWEHPNVCHTISGRNGWTPVITRIVQSTGTAQHVG